MNKVNSNSNGLAIEQDENSEVMTNLRNIGKLTKELEKQYPVILKPRFANGKWAMARKDCYVITIYDRKDAKNVMGSVATQDPLRVVQMLQDGLKAIFPLLKDY